MQSTSPAAQAMTLVRILVHGSRVTPGTEIFSSKVRCELHPFCAKVLCINAMHMLVEKMQSGWSSFS